MFEVVVVVVVVVVKVVVVVLMSVVVKVRLSKIRIEDDIVRKCVVVIVIKDGVSLVSP